MNLHWIFGTLALMTLSLAARAEQIPLISATDANGNSWTTSASQQCLPACNIFPAGAAGAGSTSATPTCGFRSQQAFRWGSNGQQVISGLFVACIATVEGVAYPVDFLRITSCANCNATARQCQAIVNGLTANRRAKKLVKSKRGRPVVESDPATTVKVIGDDMIPLNRISSLAAPIMP